MAVFRYSPGRMKPLSVDGGADDLATLGENRAACGRWAPGQRVLERPPAMRSTPSCASAVNVSFRPSTATGVDTKRPQ